jgi:hypothetical protein
VSDPDHHQTADNHHNICITAGERQARHQSDGGWYEYPEESKIGKPDRHVVQKAAS